MFNTPPSTDKSWLSKLFGWSSGARAVSSRPSAADILKPLSQTQLQNIVASIDTDLGVTEQIVAGLQAQLRTTLGSIQNSLLPAGSVICFAGSQAPPNFHLCDGSAFSKADFPELYAAIGSAYSQPGVDSQTYFNIPDLRGMFVRGCDYGRGVDSSPSRGLGTVQPAMTAQPASGAFQTAEAGAHQHTMFFWSAKLSGSGHSDFLAASLLGNSYNIPTSANGAHSHPVVGGDVETCPINVAMNYIIKIV